MVEEVCEFVYELYILLLELEDKLWRRIFIILVEDIGMGDLLVVIIINNLN